MSDDTILDRLEARMIRIIRRMTVLTWLVGINLVLTAGMLALAILLR
jgi:hypothetical protein